VAPDRRPGHRPRGSPAGCRRRRACYLRVAGPLQQPGRRSRRPDRCRSARAPPCSPPAATTPHAVAPGHTRAPHRSTAGRRRDHDTPPCLPLRQPLGDPRSDRRRHGCGVAFAATAGAQQACDSVHAPGRATRTAGGRPAPAVGHTSASTARHTAVTRRAGRRGGPASATRAVSAPGARARLGPRASHDTRSVGAADSVGERSTDRSPGGAGPGSPRTGARRTPVRRPPPVGRAAGRRSTARGRQCGRRQRGVGGRRRRRRAGSDAGAPRPPRRPGRLAASDRDRGEAVIAGTGIVVGPPRAPRRGGPRPRSGLAPSGARPPRANPILEPLLPTTGAAVFLETLAPTPGATPGATAAATPGAAPAPPTLRLPGSAGFAPAGDAPDAPVTPAAPLPPTRRSRPPWPADVPSSTVPTVNMLRWTTPRPARTPVIARACRMPPCRRWATSAVPSPPPSHRSPPRSPSSPSASPRSPSPSPAPLTRRHSRVAAWRLTQRRLSPPVLAARPSTRSARATVPVLPRARAPRSAHSPHPVSPTAAATLTVADASHDAPTPWRRSRVGGRRAGRGSSAGVCALAVPMRRCV
jgi:hypothetical protein